MSSGAQRLTIEIEPGEPIHGRLIHDGGAARSFRGWLELSAMLEAARCETRGTGPRDDQGDHAQGV